MMKTVLLSIKGKQSYLDQEPEIIELMTEGTMEYRAGGWDIRYEETDLTGLQGGVGNLPAQVPEKFYPNITPGSLLVKLF